MRRAYGIIRVSQRRGREGESFISPGDQRKRIADTCQRERIELAATFEEIDVSGGTPLERRAGVLEAVQGIEAGEAEVLIVGYFDRLVRSVRVQGEIVSRVEAAGGEVLAVDYGRVSEETATQWLSGTMLGAVHEYYRRSATERIASAQADAVARGIPPLPQIPIGLRREVSGHDNRGREIYSGPFLPGPDAPLVVAAFERRAEGATVLEVRAFLAAAGIRRSYSVVDRMLGNRAYLGELHFGKLVNPHAHPAIVPRELFNRVQRMRSSRGRRAKSDRLLARQKVLRHDLCGSLMNVGTQTQNGRSYPFYRCPTVGDCPERVAIGAEIVEVFVVEKLRAHLAGRRGRASAAHEARRTAAAREKAEADFDSALRTFAGFEEEEAARERLEELAKIRDDAIERDERLSGSAAALTVSMKDWDRFALPAKRAIVRATIEAVWVSKAGRGADRLSVSFLGE